MSVGNQAAPWTRTGYNTQGLGTIRKRTTRASTEQAEIHDKSQNWPEHRQGLGRITASQRNPRTFAWLQKSHTHTLRHRAPHYIWANGFLCLYVSCLHSCEFCTFFTSLCGYFKAMIMKMPFQNSLRLIRSVLFKWTSE